VPEATRYRRRVYITDLRIDHLKLLRNFRLEFKNADGTPRKWTVLVGENGRCKTSVLRAIALAASGAARAGELADLASLADKRVDHDMTIVATFALPSDARREGPSWPATPPSHLASRLEMPAGLSSIRGTSDYGEAVVPNGIGASTDPLFEIRGANRPHWFVAGYGTSRVLPRPGQVEPVSNPSVSRLLSLFDKGSLIGTGFADLLADSKAYSELLRQVLIGMHVLPADALDIELRGRGGIRHSKDLVEGSRFELRSGKGSMKVPATWLSQGYQSTIAWIADLLGHIVLEAESGGSELELAKLQGLVLIDEIDLHLHPKWQVKLISSLKTALPQMQFVVTTHSPMVLPALRPEEIVMLELDDEGNVQPHHPESSPMLQTGTALYRDFFGIDELHPANLAAKYQHYAFLVGNPKRTDDEEREMEAIRVELAANGLDPEWEPVARSAE
jgi:predicted ATPase